MNLSQYHQINGRKGLDRLAEKMGTSGMYLSQIAHGHRQASWRFAQRLEAATDGQVTAREQRPDIYKTSDPAVSGTSHNEATEAEV